MTRDIRTHIFNDDNPSGDVRSPKFLTKDEFGRRLYRLMLAKGMRQSDLAREAGLPRDSVSTYVRGKVFPTPISLQKLAGALGVDEAELLPNHTYQAIEADDPDFEMKVSPGNTSKAWVRLNRLMSLSAAVKIAEIVNADAADAKTADRS